MGLGFGFGIECKSKLRENSHILTDSSFESWGQLHLLPPRFVKFLETRILPSMSSHEPDKQYATSSKHKINKYCDITCLKRKDVRMHPLPSPSSQPYTWNRIPVPSDCSCINFHRVSSTSMYQHPEGRKGQVTTAGSHSCRVCFFHPGA